MTALCTADDVSNRLRRALTTAEVEYAPAMIEEAQALVLGYLGCGEDPYEELADVPDAVRIVTSRMVARVIEQGQTEPGEVGAVQVGNTAGPFGKQITFAPGARLGSPWLAKADKESLDPYRCDSKAFGIDTARARRFAEHSEACSLRFGATYCSCGADIAGAPIYGV